MDKASQRWGYKFVSLKGGSPSPSSPPPQCSSETQSREHQQKQLGILKEKLSAAEFQNDNLKKKIDNLTSAYTAIRNHLMLMENTVDEQRDSVASLQVKVIVVIKLNHTAH
jgi:septal ring factor EnvC (AmiA/AmiB activator)